jgi:hypothetical protein
MKGLANRSHAIDPMRRLLVLAAPLVWLAAAAGPDQPGQTGGPVPPLFTSFAVLEATLEAPLADLIARGRKDTDYAVIGKLTVRDPATGNGSTVPDIRLTTRGHTSLRESECDFPKLKITFPQTAGRTVFDGIGALKIGTHCSDRADGPGGKYGRWPNEKAAHREAFVYRLLEAMTIPSLKARPARITYVDSKRPGTPLVRNAMLLEDDSEALKRFGARSELPANQFGSAPSVFAMPDIAKLFFGQAMIGNFDWCLRMAPNDTYRCNDTTPIWNVLGLIRPQGMAVPLIHDFDISGIVTTRHIWFDKVFNAAFAPTEAEVEVLAQVQRTRSVFPRDLLDATRAELVGRKAAAYQALADSPLDDEGRTAARKYLDAFFRAIETDEAFYRPMIVLGTPVYLDAAATRPACPEEAPAGTPVTAPVETSGDKSRVVLLDALWQWAEKCEAVRVNPVWIPTAAISPSYPQ